jgi:putative hydrolase of the HAD superfamily
MMECRNEEYSIIRLFIPSFIKKKLMLNTSAIRYLALDADDTLWMNEPIFTKTQDACKAIVQPFIADDVALDAKLYEYEKKNLALFGYGIKGFTLSMIETVIELSAGKVSGAAIQQIIELGKDMLQHPVHLLETVEKSVKKLSEHFVLMVITKGDLFDQENKLARSGIADYFQLVEIVSEKNESTYRSLLERHNISPSEFCMVGNSLKSDILPVLQVGAQAVHIPYHTTWELEKITDHELAGYTYTELGRMSELVEVLVEPK